MSGKKCVVSSQVPPCVGGSPHAIKIGKRLFISSLTGQATNSNGQPASFKEQTKQALDNLKLVLQEAGYTLKCVVRIMVLITDMTKFGEVNEVYREVFAGLTLPARTAYQVSGLAVAGAVISLDAVAIDPAEQPEVVSSTKNEDMTTKEATAPLNQGMKVGNDIYLSGLVGNTKEVATSPVPGGSEAEAKQALLNLGHVLKASGLSFENVVRTSLYLADMADFWKVNEVYKEFFPQTKSGQPSRICYEVPALPIGAKVEIDAVAVADISTKERVIAEKSAIPLSPKSQAIKGGDVLYTSGQMGQDPVTRAIVSGGIEAETKLTLENMKHILEASGYSFGDVVKMTIQLTDLDQLAVVENVLANYLPDNKQARTVFQVPALPIKGLIEIDAIAIKQ